MAILNNTLKGQLSRLNHLLDIQDQKCCVFLRHPVHTKRTITHANRRKQILTKITHSSTQIHTHKKAYTTKYTKIYFSHTNLHIHIDTHTHTHTHTHR